MDLQKLFDTMASHERRTRGRYQLTLGKLIERLGKCGVKKPVLLGGEITGCPGNAMSYRGYYSDLAFAADNKKIACGAFLKLCKKALNKTFEGYKGGDFTMDANTPVWVSEYGQSSGVAIMEVIEDAKTVTLVTKLVD